MTQFGRAMQALDIQIICANTPQAKGRIERANQTLQDRLVKELRLRGISGGDVATGPDLVVTAMVAGRKAANTIDAYLY